MSSAKKNTKVDYSGTTKMPAMSGPKFAQHLKRLNIKVDNNQSTDVNVENMTSNRVSSTKKWTPISDFLSALKGHVDEAVHDSEKELEYLNSLDQKLKSLRHKTNQFLP